MRQSCSSQLGKKKKEQIEFRRHTAVFHIFYRSKSKHNEIRMKNESVLAQSTTEYCPYIAEQVMLCVVFGYGETAHTICLPETKQMKYHHPSGDIS